MRALLPSLRHVFCRHLSHLQRHGPCTLTCVHQKMCLGFEL